MLSASMDLPASGVETICLMTAELLRSVFQRRPKFGLLEAPSLDIQVGDRQRVFLDEFATWFDLFAHERGEDFICCDAVFDVDLE